MYNFRSNFNFHFKSGCPWRSCFWPWQLWSWSSFWSQDHTEDSFRYVYTYIFIRLLSTYISDQKMCTMYPFGARFFAKIRLSIRRFTYVRFGPKRNSNCVQLMQFYGVGTLFATIINKGFIILRWKQSTSRMKMSRDQAPSQRGGFLVYSFLSIVTRSCAAAEMA